MSNLHDPSSHVVNSKQNTATTSELSTHAGDILTWEYVVLGSLVPYGDLNAPIME
ncbi:hypothetical protein [Acidithrix ferrooxidans]|uniref:hypothetical protein n=1 Tax=Acidithrix ferrooxidans TaxID=1280514 RepID=UPI001F189D4E|nr:hypothetical protein [Acidithrix ferrooxidans]